MNIKSFSFELEKGEAKKSLLEFTESDLQALSALVLAHVTELAAKIGQKPVTLENIKALPKNPISSLNA
jgi:hypothetical protein